MLDPRQFLLHPNFCFAGPTTNSLIPPDSTVSTKSTPGKIMTSSSFRISDLLQSKESEQNANSGSETSLHASSEEFRSSPLRESPSLEDSLSEHSPNGTKKARKARTIFTDKQLQELENTFDKQKYLSVQDRMDLANRMGLSDTQVKTWYQNRRTKWKRQASVGMDLLSESGNLAAVQQLLRTNPYWASCLSGPRAPFMGLGPLAIGPQAMPQFPAFLSLFPNSKAEISPVESDSKE